jgi:urease accessory protein
MTESSRAALLVLADGRFPSGGHAHSAGVEAACATGRVFDVASLTAFVEGRLHTTGRVDAAFAAAAAHGAHALGDLDAALDARLAAPRVRAVSRSLGRQLLRAGARVWPHAALEDVAAAVPTGPHQAVALGAVARAAGLDPADAAVCALHHLAAAMAAAGVRLLGLDPYAVEAMRASMATTIDALAAEAAVVALAGLTDLPAWSAPLSDILAEVHATWEVRLFAS